MGYWRCAQLPSELSHSCTKVNTMRYIHLLIPCLLVGVLAACGPVTQSQDSILAQKQEKQLAEGDAEVTPPAIVNWNEKRIAKLIVEKRDQVNLPTWTYTKNFDGKYTFVCESIGYGLPYNTRNNNPMHYEFVSTTTGSRYQSGYYQTKDGTYVWGEHTIMPQPEPNGLFIPDSAKGTWNLCKDPATGAADVTYQEEDISVFPYKLPSEMVEGYHGEPVKK